MALAIDPGNKKVKENRARVAQLIRPPQPQPLRGAPGPAPRNPAGKLQQRIDQGNVVNTAHQQMHQFHWNMMRMR
jgi:hypothetical protein